MLDRLHLGVSLTSLLPHSSLEPSSASSGSLPSSVVQHLRPDSSISMSSGWSEVGLGSPVPIRTRSCRRTMAGYSQDRSQPLLVCLPETDLLATASRKSEPDSHHRLARVSARKAATDSQSSQSTNLSVSSLPNSPCPPPRHRRLPMLTKQPVDMANFRFPRTTTIGQNASNALEASIEMQPPRTALRTTPYPSPVSAKRRADLRWDEDGSTGVKYQKGLCEPCAELKGCIGRN